MGQSQSDPEDGLLDLAGIPLDEVADMDDSVLGRSVQVLLERLRDGRLPLDSWNSSI